MIPGNINESYERDGAIIRTRTQWLLVIISLLFMLTFPMILPSYWVSTLNFALVAVVIVLGLHVITGLCGQISLGHSAMVAVGAYTTGVLVVKFGVNYWACLPVAMIMSGLVGLVFGAPSLRIKGFYLAMSTLAAQFIIMWLINHPFYDLTDGGVGLYVPPPTIVGINFGEKPNFFYLALFFAIVIIVIVRNLQRSRVGRALVAIRDNDLAASIMGINVFSYKLIAFFIGCCIAGIGGWLWTINALVITPQMFTLSESIWYLGMIIVGGMGSTTGAVAGAMFIRLLDLLSGFLSAQIAIWAPVIGALALSTFNYILFGVVVIVFLIFEPRGIYHLWENFKLSYRLYPYSY